jgi:hypothetical protein
MTAQSTLSILFSFIYDIVLKLFNEANTPSKGKAIPLQALTDPEGSRRLRLSDFKTIGTL